MGSTEKFGANADSGNGFFFTVSTEKCKKDSFIQPLKIHCAQKN